MKYKYLSNHVPLVIVLLPCCTLSVASSLNNTSDSAGSSVTDNISQVYELKYNTNKIASELNLNETKSINQSSYTTENITLPSNSDKNSKSFQTQTGVIFHEDKNLNDTISNGTIKKCLQEGNCTITNDKINHNDTNNVVISSNTPFKLNPAKTSTEENNDHSKTDLESSTTVPPSTYSDTTVKPTELYKSVVLERDYGLGSASVMDYTEGDEDIDRRNHTYDESPTQSSSSKVEAITLKAKKAQVLNKEVIGRPGKNKKVIHWQDKHYIRSVVIPVVCGMIGALALVCVGFALRSCPAKNVPNQDQETFKNEAEPVCINDNLILLDNLSDEDV